MSQPEAVRFAISVPNYNYADYLGETLESVLSQEHADLELAVSDNASTDASWAIAQAIAARDERVTLGRNPQNLGFAANLDRAALLGTAPYCLTLSSDDLMLPGALTTYARVAEHAQLRGESFVVCSTVRVIDSGGETRGQIDAERFGWGDIPIDTAIRAATGLGVRSVPARELLASSLRSMKNPLPFLSTLFPRDAYNAVGGYTAQRIMNPDKWFHWRLLGVVETAYLVDEPQFAYRWHDSNQTAQQELSGALKFWVDEYAATFQLSDDLLAHARVSRAEVVDAFLEIDIVRRGLLAVARGDRQLARRLVALAHATYPRESRRPSVRALALASRGGRPATMLAEVAAKRVLPKSTWSGWPSA